jgi:hypothetical protein
MDKAVNNGNQAEMERKSIYIPRLAWLPCLQFMVRNHRDGTLTRKTRVLERMVFHVGGDDLML